MEEPSALGLRPPNVTGDITIARFVAASDRHERWRVSVAGLTHFLTDEAAAHRIRALATAGTTYAAAYASYERGIGMPVEPLAQFVAWCEAHRLRLEQLATTPDNHALRFRVRLLSGKACETISTPLSGLFDPLKMAALWALSLAALATCFIRQPTAGESSFWLAAALALLGVLFHEIGHVTACVRHRAVQGGIGIGLYWIWPAFFADVRGSWTLAAKQRLQVSLGGLYFQSMYAAALTVLGMATASGTIRTALGITMLLMTTTLNPVLKYDGYWILSDLLDVTNLHTRIATHLRSMRDARVADWRELACSRWTWVSVVFALAAIGYMGFVFSMLIRSGASALMAIPESWVDALAAAPASAAHAGSFLAWTKLASLLLQLVFVAFGLMVLGGRSIRATLGLVTSSRLA